MCRVDRTWVQVRRAGGTGVRVRRANGEGGSSPLSERRGGQVLWTEETERGVDCLSSETERCGALCGGGLCF